MPINVLVIGASALKGRAFANATRVSNPDRSDGMSEAAVQERAFRLWERDPSRSAEQNWFLAKAELEAEAVAAQPAPALFKTDEAATAPGRKRLSTVSARHQLLAPTKNTRVPIEYSVHKVLVSPPSPPAPPPSLTPTKRRP